MSGYTEEFKLKIVKEHLKEGYSSYFLAKKYELHKSTVQEWIKQYETFGFFIPPMFASDDFNHYESGRKRQY